MTRSDLRSDVFRAGYVHGGVFAGKVESDIFPFSVGIELLDDACRRFGCLKVDGESACQVVVSGCAVVRAEFEPEGMVLLGRHGVQVVVAGHGGALG